MSIINKGTQANDRLILKWLLLLGASVFSIQGFAVADPMRPAFFSDVEEVQEAASKPLKLSLIVYAADRKAAVINGRSVRVGDLVSGHRIESIKANKVVVSFQGRSKKLYLTNANKLNKKIINSRSTR